MCFVVCCTNLVISKATNYTKEQKRIQNSAQKQSTPQYKTCQIQAAAVTAARHGSIKYKFSGLCSFQGTHNKLKLYVQVRWTVAVRSGCETEWIRLRLISKRRFAQDHFELIRKGGSPYIEIHLFGIDLESWTCLYFRCQFLWNDPYYVSFIYSKNNMSALESNSK